MPVGKAPGEGPRTGPEGGDCGRAEVAETATVGLALAVADGAGGTASVSAGGTDSVSAGGVEAATTALGSIDVESGAAAPEPT